MEQREGNGGRVEEDGNTGREPDIRSEQEEEEIRLFLNVCSRTRDGGHHMLEENSWQSMFEMMRRPQITSHHRWVCMSGDI